jgi:hypothetical protein
MIFQGYRLHAAALVSDAAMWYTRSMRNRFLAVAAFLLLLSFSGPTAIAQVKQWTYTVPIPAGKTFNSSQNIASDAAGNSVWSFTFTGNGPLVTRVLWLDARGRELLAQDFPALTAGHTVTITPLKFSLNALIVEKVDSAGSIDGEIPVARKIVRYKRFPTRVTTEEVPFSLSDVPVYPNLKAKSATGFLTFTKNGIVLEIKRFKF